MNKNIHPNRNTVNIVNEILKRGRIVEQEEEEKERKRIEREEKERRATEAELLRERQGGAGNASSAAAGSTGSSDIASSPQGLSPEEKATGEESAAEHSNE